MASSSDPDEVLRSTFEKANFQRVARLLISGGTTLLREIFDLRCPPSNLPRILKHPATEKQLKSARLTKPQWDCLYPSPAVYGKSTDFDITLLFRLLRSTCSLSPPVTGWDALPISADHSLAADLARIKYYRNSMYGHVNQNMEITDDEFPKLWQEIRDALVGIAGQISCAKKAEWQKAIDNYLHDPLTAEDERNAEELLSWYRNDMEVKKSIEELKMTTHKGMDRLETGLKGVQGGLEGAANVIETAVREEAQDIKDQLGEIHQSLGRVNSSDRSPQAAGARLRLRIDCEAITGPGPSGGSSELVAPLREPQAAENQLHAEATGGARPNTQEVLNLAAHKYLQTINPSKPEDLNGFVFYLEKVRNVLIVDTKSGSLIITVECSSLEILDELWHDYCTGHLTEMAQKFLVTENLLKELGLSEVKLATSILEDDYRACREYILQYPERAISWPSMEELHQSLGDMNSSGRDPQAAGVRLRLRIDCEAIAGPTSQDLNAEATAGGALLSTQEVLNLAAHKYLQTINLSNPEDLNGFVFYLENVRNVVIVDIKSGILVITVECSSLEILDELWHDYCTGHLTEMAQKFLVTEDILNELGLSEVKLTTTILEEDYRACREYFLQYLVSTPLDVHENHDDPMLYSELKYKVVVAIDLGTSFSGFTFAFNHKEGETGIYMNKEWRADQGYSTLKTPTCLLLNPDKSFNSFGYEAQDRFVELDDDQAQEYYYFERFKMFLYNNENLNRETILEASNGKNMKAFQVFTHSIRYLRESALEVIRERTGDEKFSCSDVQWVLTVPTILKPEAKQFMREAAYQAGLASSLNPGQLIIALESEAASVYCRERRMRDFVGESGSSDALVTDTLARPETQYVVVNVGGGFVDVTVHKIHENGAIKKIYDTGGTYGGQEVNKEFRFLLESIFTSAFIQKYARQNPADWLYLMNDFEVKKRGKRVFEGRTTRIRLPETFVSKFPAKGRDINLMIQRRYSPEDIKVLRNEYLCLEPEIMTKLFDPVLNGIVNHLSNLFAKKHLSKIECVFLVGGFTDSIFLQERVKHHFGSRYPIMVPQYASLAVAQGAVMLAQRLAL